jgi:predicted XRE-type DNA-binding protein
MKTVSTGLIIVFTLCPTIIQIPPIPISVLIAGLLLLAGICQIWYNSSNATEERGDDSFSVEWRFFASLRITGAIATPILKHLRKGQVNMADYVKGSGNVYRDLGFECPEEELAKSRLASMIYDIIEERRLTQVEAARILGIDQPKVSYLKNGRLGGFSYERLFSFLRKLDCDIEIVVRERSKNQPAAEITVSAAV